MSVAARRAVLSPQSTPPPVEPEARRRRVGVDWEGQHLVRLRLTLTQAGRRGTVILVVRVAAVAVVLEAR